MGGGGGGVKGDSNEPTRHFIELKLLSLSNLFSFRNIVGILNVLNTQDNWNSDKI